MRDMRVRVRASRAWPRGASGSRGHGWRAQESFALSKRCTFPRLLGVYMREKKVPHRELEESSKGTTISTAFPLSSLIGSGLPGFVPNRPMGAPEAGSGRPS